MLTRMDMANAMAARQSSPGTLLSSGKCIRQLRLRRLQRLYLQLKGGRIPLRRSSCTSLLLSPGKCGLI